MDENVSALERAFALAATGRYASILEVSLQLKREGYSQAQLEGPMLHKQIMAIILKNRRRDDHGKDPAAVSLGKRGGKARAEALSKKERANIAKKAAAARWKKD